MSRTDCDAEVIAFTTSRGGKRAVEPLTIGHYQNMSVDRTPVDMNRLQCVECGRVLRENERGRTARLTVDDEVVLYCSECDKREFGAS